MRKMHVVPAVVLAAAGAGCALHLPPPPPDAAIMPTGAGGGPVTAGTGGGAGGDTDARPGGDGGPGGGADARPDGGGGRAGDGPDGGDAGPDDGGDAGTCPAGFLNCNGLPIDGCETDVRISHDHCGGCFTPCAPETVCSAGTCSGTLAFEHPDTADGVVHAGSYARGLGSIAVDAADVPHVAYQARWADVAGPPTYEVLVRRRTGADAWTTVVTRQSSSVAYSAPSLAAAHDGSICFAVVEPASTPSLIAGCVGAASVTPLAAADRFSRVSLRLDPIGTPIVAYVDAASAATLRVRYDSDDALESATSFPALAVRQAPSGALHAAYLAAAATTSEVRHAAWDGVTWTTDTVDPGATGDLGCLSLAVDGAGRPHVLYADTTARSLVLADWDAGATTWRTADVHTLAADDGGFLACALALDAGGAPHVAYAISNPGGNDPPVASFSYAISNGTTWSTATVTAPPVPGCTAAEPNRTMEMVLDSADRPHIAYTACGIAYVHLQ
jgi:hypothetical protein